VRAAAAWAAAWVVIGCAGCTASPAHPAAASQSPSRAAASPTAASVALTLPARGLPSPGCSTATATSALLSNVRTAMVPTGAGPFGVAVAPDGRWAFVALPGSIEVLRTGPSLIPVTVATIPVATQAANLGETLSPDGRYLLAADGSGAVVVSVTRAEQGRPDAVLGRLTDPAAGSGAIEVVVSPGDGYAFVTEEGRQRAAVFNLRRALTRGFGPADFVGTIPLGISPVGLAVSPDGRWLYVTSESVPGQTPVRLRPPGGGSLPVYGAQGTLTVVSLPRAETDPAKSVVATVAAGCSPVRVITSADGREVWVTARESDDLLCFSAARLLDDPARALVAVVRVGAAPVGLMLVRNGSLIVVADSDRFQLSGAKADLSVVSVIAAVAGKPAVLGRIPAGQFPREMALVPGGQTLLVSNYASGQVEAVSVPGLP
jgi:DNA-binding beta-propeller fold protein YncE